VDAYVIPQVAGWIREGVSRYQIFMNRFRWAAVDSLLCTGSTLEAFGRRDEVCPKSRDPGRQPEWKQFSDIKQTIRTEARTRLRGAAAARSSLTSLAGLLQPSWLLAAT